MFIYIYGLYSLERLQKTTEVPEATDLSCHSKTSTAIHEDTSKTLYIALKKRVKYKS